MRKNVDTLTIELGDEEIMDKKTLGSRLRRERKKRNLTLEKVAESADIGLVFLGEIERGVKMPSLNTFIKILNALDISADTLIYDETKSGRHILENKLSEEMGDLTPEEYAAVTSIMLLTIKKIKDLRKTDEWF